LLSKIGAILSSAKKRVTLHIPYDKAGLVETLHKENAISKTDYKDEYIKIEAVLNPELYAKFKQYVID
jgi:GTP-binding protein HflX